MPAVTDALTTADLVTEFVDVCFDGNQAAAAAALDVHRSQVNRLCSGARALTPDMAERIERAAGGRRRYRKERLLWPDSRGA